MKKLFGVLLIIGAVVAAIFVGIIMLCWGVYDIYEGVITETLTFGSLVWAVIKIVFREIVALIIVWTGIIGGVALIASK